MIIRDAAAGRSGEWSLPGRLRTLAGDLRLALLLGLGAGFAAVLAGVSGLMAAEEEYAWQAHWAFIRVLGQRALLPLALGAAAFAAEAVPAAVSAWRDWRFARGLAGRTVIVPRPRWGCAGLARPLGWRTGFGMASAGIGLVLFLSLYCVQLPAWPYFDPVVLPDVPVARDEPCSLSCRIVVNVLRDGRYQFRGEEYSPEALAEALAVEAIKRTGADGFSMLAVKIRADYRAPYGAVSHLLESCRKARLWKVSFGVRGK
jgi:biopolymer transport protein ExbD